MAVAPSKGISFNEWKKVTASQQNPSISVPALAISMTGPAIVKIPTRSSHHVQPSIGLKVIPETSTDDKNSIKETTTSQPTSTTTQHLQVVSQQLSLTPCKQRTSIQYPVPVSFRHRYQLPNVTDARANSQPARLQGEESMQSMNSVTFQNPNTVKVGNRYHCPWIPKPIKPLGLIAFTPQLKVAKQRLWREYRTAMKPFKNRDFHNAKRIVQRLGKRDPTELDDKEVLRLQRAQEYVSNHKQMVAERTEIQYIRALEQERCASHEVHGDIVFGIHSTPPQIYVRTPNPKQIKYDNTASTNKTIASDAHSFSERAPGLYGINFVLGGWH